MESLQVWLDGVRYLVTVRAPVVRGDLVVTDRGVLRCAGVVHAISGPVCMLVATDWEMDRGLDVLEPILLVPMES